MKTIVLLAIEHNKHIPDLAKLVEQRAYTIGGVSDANVMDANAPGPVAGWLIPRVLTFKGSKHTNCPKELQGCLEGTVGWSPSMFGDVPPVIDKHGVTHSPKPLYEASCPTQVSDLEHRVAELEAEVLQQARINGMGAERELALASRVRELERERDALRVAIDDAAYHYSQYIVEDTAHCTLTEHMLSAFDATLSASKEAA